MWSNLKDILLLFAVAIIIVMGLIIKFYSDKSDNCEVKIETQNTYIEMLKKQSDEVIMKRQEVEKEAAAALDHAKIQRHAIFAQKWPADCHDAAQMALSIALKEPRQ